MSSPSSSTSQPVRSRTQRPLLIAAVMMVAAVVAARFLLTPARRLPTEEHVPAELVRFTPVVSAPVFTGTGRDTWDRQIRERGFVLFENGEYRLYYTGYNETASDSHHTSWPSLGLAHSPDGITWTRHGDAPVFSNGWTEDVHVSRDASGYFMLAEGANDIAHALTSADGVVFTERGPLDIRRTDGTPIAKGHYGTPTLWKEGDRYFLFYERDDTGIWVATSPDRTVWTNVDDEPVIPLGPDRYDAYAVALNQIVKRDGRYYAYYHATADKHLDGPWTTNIAVSDDLIHWRKYAHNPVLPCDCSSAVYVQDGPRPLLFTMHPEVRVWAPATASETP